MDRGKIDVVQIDLTRCGGFTEAVKIASLAHDRAEDGFLNIPDAPGLGTELDEEEVRKLRIG